jgi:hypothetical protein
LLEGGDHLGQLRSQRLHMCSQGFFRCVGDIVGEGFDKGPVGDTEVLVATAQ